MVGILNKERLAVATQKYSEDPIYQKFTPEIFVRPANMPFHATEPDADGVEIGKLILPI
jgi:hypothetical protein